MKVKIHTLFQYLLETTSAAPEAIVGFSLAESPKLGEFLADLDPELPLDWNNRDFRGLPELRNHVLAQAGLDGICAVEDVLITAGAAEANYLAIMQLLQPADESVIETPGVLTSNALRTVAMSSSTLRPPTLSCRRMNPSSCLDFTMRATSSGLATLTLRPLMLSRRTASLPAMAQPRGWSKWRTACCHQMRGAATCFAGSCAAPCATRTFWVRASR